MGEFNMNEILPHGYDHRCRCNSCCYFEIGLSQEIKHPTKPSSKSNTINGKDVKENNAKK
jgi:hypothetical protein